MSQGSRECSNPGLKLANAFGVIQTDALLNWVVTKPRLRSVLTSKPAQHDQPATTDWQSQFAAVGESMSTAGGFGFGPGGSAAAGNRRIQVQIRFGF